MQRQQLSINILLLAVLSLAVSCAMLKLGHSPIVRISGIVVLGISLGWPVGYFVGGRQGAAVGSLVGVFVLFAMIFTWFANAEW